MNRFENGISFEQEEVFGKMQMLKGSESVYEQRRNNYNRSELVAHMYRMESEKKPKVEVLVYVHVKDKAGVVRCNKSVNYKLIDPRLYPVGENRNNVGFAVFAKDIVEDK